MDKTGYFSVSKRDHSHSKVSGDEIVSLCPSTTCQDNILNKQAEFKVTDLLAERSEAFKHALDNAPFHWSL